MKVIFSDGMIRSGHLDKNGYLICKINNKAWKVHRRVYFLVKGEIPDGLTINHIDGNKLNNNIENLEAISQSENAKHSWETGLADPRRGEKHGRSVLDDMKVLTILTMPRKPRNGIGIGTSNIELSYLMGVSVTRISNIRRGVEWKHLYVRLGN